MIKLKCYKVKSDRTTELIGEIETNTIPFKSPQIKIKNVKYLIKAIVTDNLNIVIVEKKRDIKELKFKVE